jgi:hypothetical protein
VQAIFPKRAPRLVFHAPLLRSRAITSFFLLVNRSVQDVKCLFVFSLTCSVESNSVENGLTRTIPMYTNERGTGFPVLGPSQVFFLANRSAQDVIVPICMFVNMLCRIEFCREWSNTNHPHVYLSTCVGGGSPLVM